MTEILKHGLEYAFNTQHIPKANSPVVVKCSCGCVCRTTDYTTVTQYNEVYYHFTCPECGRRVGSSEIGCW